MKTSLRLGIAVLAVAACTHDIEPDETALRGALDAYLAQRGQLCLGKPRWPIDVTQHDVDVGARNALQMPVLERLGLVSSGVADVVVDDEGAPHPIKVRRYGLTDAGRAYYVTRAGGTAHAEAGDGDFCAARLTLDRVVHWDVRRSDDRATTVLVRYTYHVDPAPWTRDADAQKVFPAVASIVGGAGRTELEESLRRTADGWRAVDLGDAS